MSQRTQSAVVCIMNGVGDAFLALPAIRYLCCTMGQSSVFVLTTPQIKSTVYAELGRRVFAVDQSDPSNGTDNISQINNLASALSRRSYVRWYSLNSHYPAPAQEELAIATIRPAVIERLVDRVFDPKTKRLLPEPMRQAFFRVLGTSESQAAVSRAPLISPGAERFARSWIARRAANDGQVPVAFHSDTDEEKTWQTENWLELSRLLRSKGFGVIMLGRPAPRIADCDDIASPMLSWHHQVAILAQSTLFLGVDSCFAHLADALGLPGFVLFGSTSEAVWGPRGPALRPLIAPNRVLANLEPDDIGNKILNLYVTDCVNVARSGPRKKTKDK